MKIRLVGFSFVAIALAAWASWHFVHAQGITDITGCGTIDTSGSYRLANDISGGAWCISIRASDVTFDGNNKTITSSTGEALEVADFSDLGFSNISVTNLVSSGGVRAYGDNIDHVTFDHLNVAGITVYGSDYATISNNTVGSGGISVNDADNDLHPYYPTITDNVITGAVGHDTKILLEVVGGKYHPCPEIDAIVTGNTVYNYRNDVPLEANADARVRCATHTTFSNNTMTSTGTTIGLYLRDESDYGTYENNTFITHDEEAFRIASGNPDKTLPAHNVFRNNVFWSDNNGGTYFQGVGTNNLFAYNVFVGVGSATDHNSILGAAENTYDHNTFYYLGNNGGLTLTYVDGPPPDSWTNNIFDYGTGDVFGYDGFDVSRYSGNHNLFYNRSGAVSFGAQGTTLAAWRTNTGSDANSIEGDPLLTDPANKDFTLQVGSPAIGAASDGSDIGAKPYNGSPPPLCTESWTCGDWSACSNSVQTRTCTDAYSCGTTVDRPAITQSCDSTAPAAVNDLQAH